MTEIEAFVGRYKTEEFKDSFRKTGDFSEEEIQREIENFTGQTLFGYEVVAPYLQKLSPGARILEVGAGSLLLSAYLRTLGFEVVALEPVGIGFDFLKLFSRSVLEDHPEIRHLDHGAEALGPEEGLFDLIFSINVIEHLDEPMVALERMIDRLADGGLMVHSCPNYLIPYDPHFGIPLLPGAYAWSGRLFAGKIAVNPGLWQSINFITSTRIQRRFPVEFKAGLLKDSFLRLDQDPAFKARHPVLSAVRGGLKATGLIHLLGLLPGRWATPMEFTFKKP